MGFNTANNTLYIGDSDGNSYPINTLDSLDAMSRTNPTGTGSFSLNRKANSTIGDYSFAEGKNAIASGIASHAEGETSEATGDYSHVEGYFNTASGEGAHAEGELSSATSLASHVEGYTTIASGDGSHAEGAFTKAKGDYAHVEGQFSTAVGRSQHVQGEFNILDTSNNQSSRGTYAHIVGNGTSDSVRSNAHTLDWDGNAWYAGTVSSSGLTFAGGKVYSTNDNRGVLELYNPDTSLGIKQYANSSSGGEIDVYNGDGSSVLASLFASTAGRGVLQLSDGTNLYQLTPTSIDKANKAIQIKEIWTYSHTLGSGFSAQTIYFNESYDAYIVIGTNDSDNDGRMSTFCKSGDTYYSLAWMDSYSSEYYTRLFKPQADRIYFAAGANGTASSIYKCQPVRIYGIRGLT